MIFSTLLPTPAMLVMAAMAPAVADVAAAFVPVFFFVEELLLVLRVEVVVLDVTLAVDLAASDPL